MKKITSIILTLQFILWIPLCYSCNFQDPSSEGNYQTDSTQNSIMSQAKIHLPKNGFNRALLDSEGNLWFSSNGDGVYRFKDSSFTHFTMAEGLSNNQVFAICEDQEKNIWFGTQNGLCKYRKGKFTHVPIPFTDTTGTFYERVYPILSPNAVHSIALDQKGNLWIGTAGHGAYLYDGKTFTSYLTEIGQKQEDSMHHNWVPYIITDSQGSVWFASMTNGGAIKYNGKKFQQFMISDGLSDNMVRSIYEDKSGKIWIGFNGNRKSGLTVYDGSSFKTYTKNDGLCCKRIHAIFEDQNDQLWIGSNHGNLCVFDGQKFSELILDGRKFNDILFILEDAKKNIWFGGTSGLWRFDGITVTKYS